MIQTYRQTGERWKAAYSDLRTEFLTTADDLKKQMAELNEQFGNERAAWKKEAARSRTSNILWIIVAGVAGYAVGR
ncbi:hypothetical protein FACS1894187_04900 [Synergistales bacterium]|nr:hypothetical protein FACS1894187_04900 [Synergistales bacterium]